MPKVETFDKQLVIQQATDVFHDKGYNATSMQDLVEATGLNRSSIYNSFENKHNLFLECLAAYQNKYSEKMIPIFSSEENPLKVIDYIFELYLNEMTRTVKDKGCMIVNCTSEMGNHDKGITSFLQNNQEKMLSMLESLVLKGQQQNIINNTRTSKEYGLYLFSSIQGFRTTGILVSDRNQLQGIINTITQTLI